MEDVTRYNAMEPTLQRINTHFVSLSSEETKENSRILNEILDQIIQACEDTNELFKSLYCGLFYGGSYYDGLKIKSPDEYDIDVKLNIREVYNSPIRPSNKNGYVNIQLQPRKINDRKLWSRKHKINRPYYGIRGMHAIADFYENYLDTEKVMLWMHKILSDWLGGKKRGKDRISRMSTHSYKDIKVKLRRNGPAFTFRMTGFPDNQVICFDLVPCFVFGESQWPSPGFQRNPVPEKPEFFIVPKPLPKNESNVGSRYWRLSFQEQERVLLNRKEKLKPALRLIKALRDKLQQKCIASYFIKNVFVWEVCKQPSDLWDESLSYVFMTMLKKIQLYLSNDRIDYFWYKRLNLIENIDEDTVSEISDELEDIIEDLEANPADEILVAKHFLTKRELRDFKEFLTFGN